MFSKLSMVALFGIVSLWGDGPLVQVLLAPTENMSYVNGVYTCTGSSGIINAKELEALLSVESVTVQVEGGRIEVGDKNGTDTAPLFMWSSASELFLLATGSEDCSIQFYQGFDGGGSSGSIEISAQTIEIGQQNGASLCDVVLVGGVGGFNVCIGDPAGLGYGSPLLAIYGGQGGKQAGIVNPLGYVSLESPSLMLDPLGKIVLDASQVADSGPCIVSSGKSVSIVIDTLQLLSGEGQDSQASILSYDNTNISVNTECELSQAGGPISFIASQNGAILFGACQEAEGMTVEKMESPTLISFPMSR